MKNIAVICTSLSSDAFRDIFQGIRECAVANNSNVFFFACDQTGRQVPAYGVGEYNILRAADLAKFDGIIYLAATFTVDRDASQAEEILENIDVPMVSVEGSSPRMFNLRIDNRMAMYEMVHHFIQEHGFKRICYVSGSLKGAEAKARYAGYIDAMRDYDLPFEDSWVYEGDYMPKSGRDAAEHFTKDLPEMPEAIVCANDYMAYGAQQYLQQRGIKVPGQIAVSGFDDSIQAKYYEPRLTTVSRENYKAGYAACSKLLSGISPEEVGTFRNLQTNVVTRESCGCESREEVDFAQFKKMHFEGRDMRTFFLLETRRLSAEMESVSTMEQLRETLTSYVKRMSCDDFYLCLSNEWEGIQSERSANAKYGMLELKDDYIREGYGSGTFLAFSHASHAHKDFAAFGVKEIVEGLQDKNLGRNCYAVLPLHYGDRMFGYCVISNSESVFADPLLNTWMQCISFGLETIRKQNLIGALTKKLDSLWIYDNLTGLYNRAGFNKYATPVWMECMEKKTKAALFFIDLDGLKKVNDIHGHDAGDRFIKAMAGILKKRRRHGEAIMRFAGDEFVILASGLEESEAQKYCDSIYAEVEAYNRMHNLPVAISVSIGYHLTVPEDGSGLDLAIEAADAKMYEAKREKETQDERERHDLI